MKMKPIQNLRENGPLSSEELTVKTSDRREHDIRRMAFRGPKNRGTKAGTQRLIYYLPDHDPESVVRKYIEVNESILNTSKGQISRFFGMNGSKFQESWREICDEYEIKGGQLGGTSAPHGDKQCPFCPAEVAATNFPQHIRENHS